jgi:thioredoxin-dependent adenylylsulfate APS reductase
VSLTEGRIGLPPDAEGLDAPGVIRLARERLGRDRLALVASFGPEDIVILDLLVEVEARPRVITLDTGRLPEDTYELIDRVRSFYGVEVEVVFPEATAVEAMTRAKGVNLFYDSHDNRLECCDVRKVQPLRRALASVDGWLTGLRRDQAPTRARTPKISLDLEHGLIWKVAPLADWTDVDVWAHIRARGLPYNALHDRGYPSIGCAPCTRAVEPGADPRSGRWWWEQGESRECGLHVAGPAAGITTADPAAARPSQAGLAAAGPAAALPGADR